MTAIGTRRPREGRCERCDRPLTDLVWTTWTPIAPWGPPLPPVTDWREQDGTDTHCAGYPFCAAPEVDWQARALAAEADLADAQGMERLAITMWRETEDAARSAARGDAEPPRNVSTDPGIDLFLTVKKALADAEARGRQHGALAIAWRIVDAERNNRACVLPDDKPDGWWKTRADAFASVIVAIEKLAAESTDGR